MLQVGGCWPISRLSGSLLHVVVGHHAPSSHIFGMWITPIHPLRPTRRQNGLSPLGNESHWVHCYRRALLGQGLSQCGADYIVCKFEVDERSSRSLYQQPTMAQYRFAKGVPINGSVIDGLISREKVMGYPSQLAGSCD